MLICANLFWAANIVLGRGLAGHVPPIALAYWRWTGAFLIAVGFAWPYLKQDAPILLRHWRMMLLLSATGIATYNTMSYIGLTGTTALNVLLLQSAGPLIIIVWAFALFGDRPTLRQIHRRAAVAGRRCGHRGAWLAGDAAAPVAQPWRRLDPGRHGDLWRLRRDVSPPSRRASDELPGRHDGHRLDDDPAVLSVGVHAGRPHRGRRHGLARMAYIAVFPSFIAYLFFNRGIELIGAARAGQSWHLMPVFGSILAVLFLGETFYAYHAVGIA